MTDLRDLAYLAAQLVTVAVAWVADPVYSLWEQLR